MDVLVVEDEDLLRELVVDVLSDAGLDVVAAGTAEAALDATSRSGMPRAVVTDINLGAGMSGLALADAIRALSPGVGVIFITGRPDNLDGRPPSPRERRLLKPFSLASLVLAVNRWTRDEPPEGMRPAC